MATSLPPELQPPTLDPREIAALDAQSALLVCVGVPAGTSIGLDYAEFRVGPRFSGIRAVPPGTHFLWFRLASHFILNAV